LDDAEKHNLITLKSLLSIFLKNKVLIISLSSFFAVFSVIFSLSLTNVYTSTAIVKVTNQKDAQNLPQNLSQYTNLASIAGISLPTGGSDKSEFVIKSIQSRGFFKHLYKFESIDINLFAAKSYDKKTKKIIYNKKIYDTENSKWTRKDKEKKISPPTYLEIYEEVYSENLSVVKDKDSGFIFISYTHVSPVFAKNFVSLIVDEINSLTREKDLKESSDSIEYLREQYVSTQDMGMKNSINYLITEQLGIQMLANISDFYIIEYVDSPFIPEKKSAPARAIICIIISTLGGILSLLIAYIRHIFSE
tara:strand:+ start:5442 stop:6359 length:918 start_codon:yes stop_codon:yes gene_type:complete